MQGNKTHWPQYKAIFRMKEGEINGDWASAVAVIFLKKKIWSKYGSMLMSVKMGAEYMGIIVPSIDILNNIIIKIKNNNN